MKTLVGLSYSPWSEKARWALEHHRVPFTYREYLPMFGEPLLRARLARPFGRVSVPTLFGDGEAYTDSFEIARFAERAGAGAPLFGSEREAAIAAWNERSEALLRGARALLVHRMKDDPQAIEEALPPLVPARLRPALKPLARAGVAFIASKYGTSAAPTFSHEATIRDALDALRRGLGGGSYLLGELSYADVAMATALHAVKPVRDEYIPLGPATRDVWTHAELARHYAGLLEWRDALYAKHRRA